MQINTNHPSLVQLAKVQKAFNNRTWRPLEQKDYPSVPHSLLVSVNRTKHLPVGDIDRSKCMAHLTNVLRSAINNVAHGRV